jgi:hypothetical protein
MFFSLKVHLHPPIVTPFVAAIYLTKQFCVLLYHKLLQEKFS